MLARNAPLCRVPASGSHMLQIMTRRRLYSLVPSIRAGATSQPAYGHGSEVEPTQAAESRILTQLVFSQPESMMYTRCTSAQAQRSNAPKSMPLKWCLNSMALSGGSIDSRTACADAGCREVSHKCWDHATSTYRATIHQRRSSTMGGRFPARSCRSPRRVGCNIGAWTQVGASSPRARTVREVR